jgi:CRISPR/Cas system endoribonuclease Cas6 (RAMP superfamily)
MRLSSLGRAGGLWYVSAMRFFNSLNQGRTPKVATDFLKRNDKMAALLPAVERMAALQKDCAATLPSMFSLCEILAFEEGNLLLSTPSSAVAAKLKQQLPKLQDALLKRGWHVTNIKLRVQMMKAAEIKEQMRALTLPPTAVTAFEELSKSLEQSKQNDSLIQALQLLVQRRRDRPDY